MSGPEVSPLRNTETLFQQNRRFARPGRHCFSGATEGGFGDFVVVAARSLPAFYLTAQQHPVHQTALERATMRIINFAARNSVNFDQVRCYSPQSVCVR
jgi:hypothetical protein